MDDWQVTPLEWILGDRVIVFESQYQIERRQQGYIVLDFERKFEDPDLNKLPAKLISVENLEQSYLIYKYEVILGEFKDLW
ncbi:hypothetical protein D3C78_1901430 [compost metagenome]